MVIIFVFFVEPILYTLTPGEQNYLSPTQMAPPSPLPRPALPGFVPHCLHRPESSLPRSSLSPPLSLFALLSLP